MKKRFKILILLTIIAVIVFEIIKHYLLKIDLSNHQVLEIEKCPACYGDDLCSEFIHGNIELTTNQNFWTSVLFNAKNVYFGLYKGQNVVLKKLAHTDELELFDQKLCEITPSVSPKRCDDAARNIRLLASLWASNHHDSIDYSLLKANIPPEIETFSCVRSQELIDFLYRKKKHWKAEHFLTLSFVNPEPLIVTAFPYEEGWPFPKYFGACGRWSIFEYVGQSLTNYLNNSKKTTINYVTKARLALQVLQLAFQMMHNDPILYLTDWSLDNFAVSKVLEVKLIDLENIVLVNRSMIKIIQAPGWNIDHHSVAFGCEKEQNCFSYSLEDLCSHSISDHNIFGACQGILLPLLKDGMPSELQANFPLLPRFLQECAWPSYPGGRIEAAEQLIDILKRI